MLQPCFDVVPDIQNFGKSKCGPGLTTVQNDAVVLTIRGATVWDMIECAAGVLDRSVLSIVSCRKQQLFLIADEMRGVKSVDIVCCWEFGKHSDPTAVSGCHRNRKHVITRTNSSAR